MRRPVVPGGFAPAAGRALARLPRWTLRGRCLLAAGAGVAVAGAVFAERDLLRVALVLLGLPLAAALTSRRARGGVVTRRTVSPARVPAGAPCRVRLVVENTGRLPTGVLMAAERVDAARTAVPRFVLGHLPAGARQAVAYTVRVPVRGRHVLGPLEVTVADPLGLCRTSLRLPGASRLTVLPVVEALAGLGPLAAPGAGGAPQGLEGSAPGAGEVASGTREYRPGDDLRRVHWRSTARHGELMVRSEEAPRAPRATLVLDRRPGAHAGRGPAGSFEVAVSAAASLAVALLDAGLAVCSALGSVHADGRAGHQVWRGTAGALDLVDHLVDVGTTGGGAELGLQVPDAASRPGDVVVAVLGRLDREAVGVLAPLAHGRRAVAVCVLPPQPDALLDLEGAGWTCLVLERGRPLASLWRGAGARAGAA